MVTKHQLDTEMSYINYMSYLYVKYIINVYKHICIFIYNIYIYIY